MLQQHQLHYISLSLSQNPVVTQNISAILPRTWLGIRQDSWFCTFFAVSILILAVFVELVLTGELFFYIFLNVGVTPDNWLAIMNAEFWTQILCPYLDVGISSFIFALPKAANATVNNLSTDDDSQHVNLIAAPWWKVTAELLLSLIGFQCSDSSDHLAPKHLN